MTTYLVITTIPIKNIKSAVAAKSSGDKKMTAKVPAVEKKDTTKTEAKVAEQYFSIGSVVTVDLFGAGLVVSTPRAAKKTESGFSIFNEIDTYAIRLVSGGTIICVKPEFVHKYVASTSGQNKDSTIKLTDSASLSGK